MIHVCDNRRSIVRASTKRTGSAKRQMEKQTVDSMWFLQFEVVNVSAT